uniref:Secreted protein n=1 Tax=Haemonchus placei TaxID=6290 RepID=A0A0N4W5G0_HAEPC
LLDRPSGSGSPASRIFSRCSLSNRCSFHHRILRSVLVLDFVGRSMAMSLRRGLCCGASSSPGSTLMSFAVLWDHLLTSA